MVDLIRKERCLLDQVRPTPTDYCQVSDYGFRQLFTYFKIFLLWKISATKMETIIMNHHAVVQLQQLSPCSDLIIFTPIYLLIYLSVFYLFSHFFDCCSIHTQIPHSVISPVNTLLDV